MKKMFVILSVVFSVMLCSCGKEEDNSKYNDNMSYIEFDGHEYVRYFNGYRGSMCHSPKCPCLEIYKK
jgi:uncharacterized lipoprotein YehR (DUF1307 family)